ncbi:MAG TPA: hypothetical protein VHW66_19095 [Stellaceae bacterium]|jgi:hypothetical protein|nr:hypothetical protein [Stellaceae bacterium]
MSDRATERVAGWLDGSSLADTEAPDEVWACVEIFGHRKHYGRIREIEKFGAKMLRVDIPVAAGAPLLEEGERFETFVYGGSAIFSVTPMTEEAARKWADYGRPRGASDYRRLPPPEYAPADEDMA